jgi:hypothetical protein
MDIFPIYIHMEKCGGMSLHHALRYALPNYEILKPWWYWSNESSNYFSAEELKLLKRLHPVVKGVGGHTTRSYANYEEVLDRPAFYFTFLRDPIARYLSHLNHQVNKMHVAWSVDEFLKERRFNNLMTRRIAGCDNLDLAKCRLRDDFGMVGLFESYDQSLVILSRMMFGAPNGLHYEHMNDSESETKVKFNDLSHDLQAMVTENNALDIKLYEWVKRELFPSYLDSYIGDLEADVGRFRDENSGFRYNRAKWYFLRLCKVYSERFPQRLARYLAGSSK